MRLIPALLAALLAIGPAASEAFESAVPTFTDETASAGIDHVFTGEWEFMVGGGAAVFDCNGDRMPDMLLAGGAAPATFYRNTGTVGGPLSFAAQESSLELDMVSGAYPLDIDGDGNRDLVLLRVGENVVMRGLGACRFERANEAFGFDGGDAWSTALAATWEKGARFPTIAVGNYIDRTQDAFPWGSCTDNWLHRPAGEERRFAPPLPLKPSYCALSMLFTDWNRSGAPSLRVSNDREYYKGGQEQMWRIDPGQPPALYGPADGWKPLKIWGMGIASTDLDGDGYPEYFLTSMADNKLQTLAPRPEGGAPKASFADIAFAKGVTAHRPYTGGEVKPSTAWHAQFEDVNNDGLADLFVAKGNVSEMPDFAMKDPDNLLLQKPDGTFEEAGEAAGIASFDTGRGAALADFNLDGQVDLVVVNRNSKARLWRNGGVAGNWAAFALGQPPPNVGAIGAWVEVRCGARTLRREITVGGGHAGGQLGWIHFGLGGEAKAEVRVLWPDGSEGDWQAVEANGFYDLIRGQPPRKWRPAG
ncbi:CRTAC1 family protein [Mesorhizobium sp. J428]|uniref:CRTAC1 family protein n=1 Tax=Mesorhizobium sp. J428 TaxID=2898440 RepID=UPI002151CFFD|nr:CRTAC1 family protein [Mesorhizobium sp. J428]MCR5856884.1 CRTAC1 family protein [Mesorhizobium sp. J428]